jgi:DNA integrity scanning protein DisA with diadenylate cyclase activity
MFEMIASRLRSYNKKVLDPVIELAVDIAREGREGRRIGTLFAVGDADNVLAQSRKLILDPLAGHPREARLVTEPNLQGTIKELAQLDGAFVISDEGEFVAACRYLEAPPAGVDLPLGLGARHMAGAAISRATRCVAVVASESAMVRIFDHGTLIAEVIPELWLLQRHDVRLRGPVLSGKNANEE